ncbi:MAG: hypothetical protein RPU52_07470 [Candidatus Sedimenticola sp. (ex Thyasira tokunagai)]
MVDPPIEWAWFYSQSWIKKKFGQKFLLVYTYFSGMVFIVIGIAGVVFETQAITYALSDVVQVKLRQHTFLIPKH